MIRFLLSAAAAALVAAPAGALAEDAAPVVAKPAPYAMPWQLRPVLAGNTVRSDTAVALLNPSSGGSGSTVVSTLFASYKVAPDLAPFVRLAYVANSPVSGTGGGQVLVNPILGATYSLKVADGLRAGLMFAAALPLGMGGGNDADPVSIATAKSGVLARSAMDNAMFAVNDVVLIPGAGLAYTASGLTVQLEVTVLQLIRVRGEAVQPDAFRTNMTSGLYAGYFVVPQLSIGAELRYQRWLSTPVAVAADERQRDNLTAAAGVRAHLQLADKLWLRPGISYIRPLDNPMSGLGYQLIQVDLPLAF